VPFSGVTVKRRRDGHRFVLQRELGQRRVKASQARLVGKDGEWSQGDVEARKKVDVSEFSH
jgi:hypothetical protein